MNEEKEEVEEPEQKILVSYVRDDKRQKIGVVIALSPLMVGWSQCCFKDQFSKERGILIAKGRAKVCNDVKTKPALVKQIQPNMRTIRVDLVGQAIEKMKERAERYFK